MAHVEDVLVGGQVVRVEKLDNSAQDVDDTVNKARYLAAPNLLDNWYLKDPINQQTQNVYTAAGYTIDRLYNRTTNTKLTLTDKGLKIEVTTAPGSGKNQFVSQRIENYKDLLGKTVTLSWLVTETQCSGGGMRCHLAASNSAGTNSYSFGVCAYSGDPGLYSYTMTLPDTISYSGINAAFVMHDNSAQGDYVTVAAWKLELGFVSTLAHKEGDAWVLNDPPPNKQQELAKCQRYFFAYNGVIEGDSVLTINIGGNSVQQSRIRYKLPTTMRTKPTVYNIKQHAGYDAPGGVVSGQDDLLFYKNGGTFGVDVFWASAEL